MKKGLLTCRLIGTRGIQRQIKLSNSASTLKPVFSKAVAIDTYAQSQKKKKNLFSIQVCSLKINYVFSSSFGFFFLIWLGGWRLGTRFHSYNFPQTSFCHHKELSFALVPLLTKVPHDRFIVLISSSSALLINVFFIA